MILLEPTTPSSQSSYTGALSTSSPIFYRPQSTTEDYHYYQALQVTITAAGTYVFTSTSGMDTRAYFYRPVFDPSNSTGNLIADNDDGADQFQFRLQVNLELGQTYVLVVTTHEEYVTGSFSVLATGPAYTNLLAITPSTSRPITARKFLTSILSITIVLPLFDFTYRLRTYSSLTFSATHFNNECL